MSFLWIKIFTVLGSLVVDLHDVSICGGLGTLDNSLDVGEHAQSELWTNILPAIASIMTLLLMFQVCRNID